ncbi:(R)-stereoselective amidase [Vibrio aerogenes CECT 7868]|uniref:(R)-stereoselective amidase n=1 Tax=Vibrio aerogenes CECT 7868 TaxID=1216006 RepID=A0A1M6AGF4_9VIBR|nr:carbon-nitrogen hydrolase family protein [Vibrio aerogenes]SHI35580.1 (R)-stereoselective amidase [Vibrio aerogenes CECT 7868]
MKVGLYQSLPTDGEIEKGFSTIENCLSAAVQGGAQMLVFPELFLPGYNRPDLHRAAAQTMDGAWMQRLSGLTKEYSCGLTIGWAEACGDKVYNAATCFDQTGNILAHYRKIQLFGEMEKQSFVAGDAYQTFSWGGQKAALLICYDIEFPQHCRALARQGVTLIFVPTANPKGYEHVSRVLVPARAAEMAVTIVYANYCGTEQGLSYAGHSLIAGPDSQPIAAAGLTETLFITDINAQMEFEVSTNTTQLTDYQEII